METNQILSDLIDDLKHQQLTELLNFMCLRGPVNINQFRASVKRWRKINNLPRDD